MGAKYQNWATGSLIFLNLFYFLGDIVSSFPLLLETSRFVFVPGPQDPGPENILPRPPLSRLATLEIRKKIPFAEFSTNPCRCVKSWSSDYTIFYSVHCSVQSVQNFTWSFWNQLSAEMLPESNFTLC